MNEITEKVMSYFNDSRTRKHHRYKSWENCSSHFRIKQQKKDNIISDLDSLHLGFYLASWGMYRGSGFLLQNSHEIHNPVLKLIFNEKFNPLWSFKLDNVSEDWLDLLFSLKEEIKEAYRQATNPDQKVSDTLITKILLGVVGITPAYDRYFIEGCKMNKLNYCPSFTRKSYEEIIKFYLDNYQEFEKARGIIQQRTKLEFPPMRLVDMYFWSVGYKLNTQGKNG